MPTQDEEIKKWARTLSIVGDPTRLKILLALYASDILMPERKAIE